ncbi:MAG: hypothetical protein HY862_12345 [Chloroflexi bacterium]|nr:hypothetical protein [Chloroflexota bacterium]
MTKEEFAQLFRHHLDLAVQNAEERYNVSVPRNFVIEYYGKGHFHKVPAEIDVDTAIDALFIDENKFFLIIDLVILEIRNSITRVFVRPSGHPPDVFERTWNDPPGSGPFHHMFHSNFRGIDE